MLVLNSKRRKLIIVVFSALVLLISVFIFVNSSMDYEASHSSSGAIADIIRPGESLADREQTEFTIRKLAHQGGRALDSELMQGFVRQDDVCRNRLLVGQSFAESTKLFEQCRIFFAGRNRCRNFEQRLFFLFLSSALGFHFFFFTLDDH